MCEIVSCNVCSVATFFTFVVASFVIILYVGTFQAHGILVDGGLSSHVDDNALEYWFWGCHFILR